MVAPSRTAAALLQGRTIKDIAAQAGVHTETLSRALRRGCCPVALFDRLARALGVAPRVLAKTLTVADGRGQSRWPSQRRTRKKRSRKNAVSRRRVIPPDHIFE